MCTTPSKVPIHLGLNHNSVPNFYCHAQYIYKVILFKCVWQKLNVAILEPLSELCAAHSSPLKIEGSRARCTEIALPSPPNKRGKVVIRLMVLSKYGIHARFAHRG
jgi:hypothetical protein